MRKKVFGRKLNRNRRSRSALFKAQMKSMILHGKIKTTKAKALALNPELDRLIGLVKKNDLAAHRAALATLGNDRKATDMLFEKYVALADSRNSGFTSMALLENRKGDDADMVSISWVELPAEKKEEKKEEK